jgi:hypothetical protein
MCMLAAGDGGLLNEAVLGMHRSSSPWSPREPEYDDTLAPTQKPRENNSTDSCFQSLPGWRAVWSQAIADIKVQAKRACM